MTMHPYIRLLRPQQWYKNALVFLPLAFAGLAWNPDLIGLGIQGFVALSFCSSFNYIVNDALDKEKDKTHPEKKERPIASGAVSVTRAMTIGIALLALGLALAFYLNFQFFVMTIVLVAMTQLYSFVLKKIVFADILTVAINFVIRAVSGSVLIGVEISSWLVACTFFFALFLLAGKRYSDSTLLKSDAVHHKETLPHYTKEVTNALMIMTTVMIIMAYTAYAFLGQYPSLTYSIPIALFVIFRYFSIIYSGSPIARHPEKIFSDKATVAGMLLWAVAVGVAIYII